MFVVVWRDRENSQPATPEPCGLCRCYQNRAHIQLLDYCIQHIEVSIEHLSFCVIKCFFFVFFLLTTTPPWHHHKGREVRVYHRRYLDGVSFFLFIVWFWFRNSSCQARQGDLCLLNKRFNRIIRLFRSLSDMHFVLTHDLYSISSYTI